MIVTKAEYDELMERFDMVRDLCVMLKVPPPKLLRTVEKLLADNYAMYARINKIKIRPYGPSKREEGENEVQ
jgi:hypothetical protein